MVTDSGGAKSRTNRGMPSNGPARPSFLYLVIPWETPIVKENRYQIQLHCGCLQSMHALAMGKGQLSEGDSLGNYN